GSFEGAGAATVISTGSQVWGESAKGSYNLGLERGYSFNNDLLISVNKSYREFVFDGFVGGSLFYRQNEGMEARTQGGLTIPAFYSLKASVNPVAVASNVYKEQVNSLYGRLAVSWKNLIYTEATLRNDWSSTLPLTTRSYLYPSVAASFIASELLPKMDWLSFWKLRGSWTVSKTPAGVYAINSVYTINNNVWGNLSGASFPTSIRGIDVRAESASTFEIGTAVNLWKSRASVDVAYYNKRMYDFIRSTGITPASGFTSKFVNIGEEITRKGVEITANLVPVESRDWRWDISVNWSKYARYYTKLDEEFSTDRPWVKVGNRVDHYILRDYQKDKEGNIIHNNGLPLYSGYDSLFGYSDPDWIWGIGSNLRYKNWQLAISLDGRVGGIAQTTTEMYMWRAGSHPKSVTPERMADVTTAGSKNYTGKGVKVVSGTVSYDTYGNITSDTRVFAANDIPVTYKTYTEAYHKGTAWGGSPSPVD
ncbi:MAG: SusC/RagA family TonB-linked outer membrane protein, partial [Bacteroidales bacterium]|nr:SusC/RagA family TonB-linked outer membrane protein [Bacteroidales bacterium]